MIPATLGAKSIYISTDIVDQDVPFLLSRAAMKKMRMIIDFGTDVATFLGISYPLTITSSGHYTIPLTPSVQLLSTIKCLPDTQVVFTVSTTLSKHQQALKLHRQFAHAPADRIIALLNAAGKPWCTDKDLKSELMTVSGQCQTCLEYGKELPKPSVALPSANCFQDTVALDLKFYNMKILLHLIDYATRYSACTTIPSKRPDQVVKAMFSNWIAIFGPPSKFLSDNGGEFINQELLDLCEAYNITLKTTGAEAPWSNGLIERHNQVLGNMLDRVLGDLNCNFEIALAWCVNAKNSLQNVHGFSPYQLVFGHNPVLPNPFNNKPPAFEDTESRSSEIVRTNLNALHSSRVAFMESERSERLRRALRTNTRTYSDQVVVNGDKVYYKRNDAKKWKGPAYVLGRDGQQILLKHGGYYIRVHPCRVRLAREEINASSIDNDPPPSPSAVNVLPPSISAVPLRISSSSSIPHSLPTAHLDVLESSDSEDEPQNNIAQEPQDNSSLDIDPVPQPSLTSPPTTPCSTPRIAPTPPRSNMQRQSSYHLRARQFVHNPLHGYTNSESATNVPSSAHTDDTQAVATNQNSMSAVVRSNGIDPDVSSLRKGDKLFVKLANSSNFIPCTLLKRSGKKSSKLYRNEWNVKYPNDSVAVLNFDSDVSEWLFLESYNSDTEILTFINTTNSLNPTEVQIENAKREEMEAWKLHNVYDEVPNEGQDCMSVRWVVTPKVINGVASVKARLVAKGFQELQNFRKDSPTCSRESIRLTLATIASKKWNLQGIDIRRAFLQGNQIDRVVYLKPPPEANTKMLWQLNKCVYGLGDASRAFYLKLHNELTQLQVKQSTLDRGLYFLFENGLLVGILVVHVDDILYGGTASFVNNVIRPLSQTLAFGTEHYRMFEYLGLELIQNSDFIP